MAFPTYAALDKNTVLTLHFENWLKTEPINQSYQNVPVVKTLMERRKNANGGSKHKAPIFRAIDPTGGAVARGQDIETKVVDPVTQVESGLVLVRESVGIYLQDELDAENGIGLTSYAEIQVRAAMMRMWDNLESMLVAASTTAGNVTSLGEIMASSGTTMGLSTATESSWASADIDASAYTFTTSGPAKFRAAMRKASRWNGVGRVDTIFVGETIWDAVQATGFSKSTFQAQMGKGPMEFNLGSAPREWFENAEIIYAPRVAAGTAYFINSEHLYMVVGNGYGVRMTPWRPMTGKLGRECDILFYGNTFCDCRASTAKHTGVV